MVYHLAPEMTTKSGGVDEIAASFGGGSIMYGLIEVFFIGGKTCGRQGFASWRFI